MKENLFLLIQKVSWPFEDLVIVQWTCIDVLACNRRNDFEQNVGNKFKIGNVKTIFLIRPEFVKLKINF
jgi:hypothetical protein